MTAATRAAPAALVVPSAATAHDWYRDAVVYEVPVRAFRDSNGDGIGDFRGLTTKLDYLCDLGVTALWLLPFYPSPLRDDGYDIADYRSVNPAFGTTRDFRAFLAAAHERGLRVITELVLNHTSDQHPWFQRARRAPAGSRWRDYYVWSDTTERYADARIIFSDFETSNWAWDPVAGAYYWHRFYSHQPDLNYESPDVRREMTAVVDYWLGLGVDGLRLDAVPYLFERDGTSCENLPETHAFLRDLRAHIDARFPGRMLLAEANQWPEDAAAYFGAGDECHMAFHFPLMPRLFMALRMEDRFPVVDILRQTPDLPPGGQWALFLRNHDELTLEMVTDEERDYMYRVYANDAQARINLGIRRRLAPLLDNDPAKIRLLHGLLLSLPGTPVLYYGDEIGMGDNIYLGDRDGVRTPMQWSPDRNAGFSEANPQQLYLPAIIDPRYHYELVNVETQRDQPASLLSWMSRLVTLRTRHSVFGRGRLDLLRSDNPRVLAFVREDGDDIVLVVANLSRLAQYVELDLHEYQGATPVELLGQTPFPRVGELPYLLTLGPHAFYWLALQRPSPRGEHEPGHRTIAVTGSWTALFDRPPRALTSALVDFVRGQRWFGARSRQVRDARLVRVLPLAAAAGGGPLVAVLQLEFESGEPERYALVLSIQTGDAITRTCSDHPADVVARLVRGNEEALLVDGLRDPEVATAFLRFFARRRRRDTGLLVRPARRGVNHWAEGVDDLAATPLGGEQSNSSVSYGDALVLKLFRRLQAGPHPEVEIGEVLAARAFPSAPRLLASVLVRGVGEEAAALAVLHELVPNEGDAWSHVLNDLGHHYDDVLSDARHADWDAPGYSLEQARGLGRRVAELHDALATSVEPAFTPETFTALYQRSLYQSLRTNASRTFSALRQAIRRGLELPAIAEKVVGLEPDVLERLRLVADRRMTGRRIRVHGDLHLGQVLSTGDDFVILDFEGEPARPLAERRLKRSSLRDVAGMIRSYDYATRTAAREVSARGAHLDDTEVAARLERAGRSWYRQVSDTFVRSYLAHANPAYLAEPEDVEWMLRTLLLDKALYEVRYELDHRPGWSDVPLLGVLSLMEHG